MQLQSARETVENMLTLPDERYFPVDEASYDELNDTLIVMDDFEGTAIGVPRSIEIARRRELPLLWVTRASALRNWQVEGMRNNVLVVSDLSTGAVSLHNALAGPKRIDYRHVPRSLTLDDRPSKDSETAVTLDSEMLDVRTVSNISWSPRRLAVTMLIYDWKSNTETVRLEGDETRPHEMAPRRRTAFLRSVDARAADAGQADSAGHIAVPNRVPKNAPIPVRASLEISRDDVVLAPEADNEGASLLLGSAILFGLDRLPDLPAKVDLAIPAEIATNNEDKDAVKAAFEFDYREALPHFTFSGTCQTYFIFGKNVYGPYPVTFE